MIRFDIATGGVNKSLASASAFERKQMSTDLTFNQHPQKKKSLIKRRARKRRIGSRHPLTLLRGLVHRRHREEGVAGMNKGGGVK